MDEGLSGFKECQRSPISKISLNKKKRRGQKSPPEKLLKFRILL